jgi:hypothetical protein
MTRSHTMSGPRRPARPSSDGDPSSTFVGRLVFATGHGPRSVIVECHRSDGGYTIHVPEFNEAANYLVDAAVTLTAAGVERTHPAEVITGRSRRLADRDVDAGTTQALEQWCDGMPSHYFHISPTSSSTQGRGRSNRRGRPHDTPVRRGQQMSTP